MDDIDLSKNLVIMENIFLTKDELFTVTDDEENIELRLTSEPKDGLKDSGSVSNIKPKVDFSNSFSLQSDSSTKPETQTGSGTEGPDSSFGLSSTFDSLTPTSSLTSSDDDLEDNIEPDSISEIDNELFAPPIPDLSVFKPDVELINKKDQEENISDKNHSMSNKGNLIPEPDLISDTDDEQASPPPMPDFSMFKSDSNVEPGKDLQENISNKEGSRVTRRSMIPVLSPIFSSPNLFETETQLHEINGRVSMKSAPDSNAETSFIEKQTDTKINQQNCPVPNIPESNISPRNNSNPPKVPVLVSRWNITDVNQSESNSIEINQSEDISIISDDYDDDSNTFDDELMVKFLTRLSPIQNKIDSEIKQLEAILNSNQIDEEFQVNNYVYFYMRIDEMMVKFLTRLSPIQNKIDSEIKQLEAMLNSNQIDEQFQVNNYVKAFICT